MAYEQSGKYLAAASLRMAHSTQSASRSLNMSWMSCVAGSVALIAGGAMTMPLISHAASPNERSFIMIKPDGVHRSLISDIIGRFERRGFKLVGIKILVPSTQLAGQHYDEHKERPFFPKLVNFLSSGAVVAMVWEGTDVIKTGRTMIGATNPLASPLGSIRGDYGIDTGRNIIHGRNIYPHKLPSI